MRYTAFTLLIGNAIASALPQEFDWDAIEKLPPLTTPSIPVVSAKAAQTTVSVNTASIAKAVSSAVLAHPSDAVIAARDTIMEAREEKLTTSANNASADNSQCVKQPAADDTAEVFSNTTKFADAAKAATAPAGYQQIYTNQNGSSEFLYGYMGYSTLDTYDVAKCAQRCNAITGCQSINIYFERDPSIEPKAGCTNPPSETVVKCVYWGSPVTIESTTNDGQWRKNFKVVIQGSNGYVNNTHSKPSGYEDPIYLNNSAILAPLNCRGYYTYMGVKLFQNKPFSIDLCASACSATSEYNRAHPDKTGYFQTCQFFNTYILYNETTAVGQYCAMYNETWPKSFATNNGQWRENFRFTIKYSWMASNTTGDLDKPRGCGNGQQCS